MNGEDFAFFRWVGLREKEWNEALGWAHFAPSLNGAYLYLWNGRAKHS